MSLLLFLGYIRARKGPLINGGRALGLDRRWGFVGPWLGRFVCVSVGLCLGGVVCGRLHYAALGTLRALPRCKKTLFGTCSGRGLNELMATNLGTCVIWLLVMISLSGARVSFACASSSSACLVPSHGICQTEGWKLHIHHGRPGLSAISNSSHAGTSAVTKTNLCVARRLARLGGPR
jgi:hypothetical protein